MTDQDLLAIFDAALAAVDPYTAARKALRLDGTGFAGAGPTFDLTDFDRIIVVGAGKATARMALAAEETLGGRIGSGCIVVKYGHRASLRIIEQVEASHPLPDDAGVRGTQRILDMVRKADEKTLVLCLLSGGGSALLVAPAAGLGLEDKQAATNLLLRAGASIGELNAVRKHLSAVKGGRLAQAAFPATVITLILSDVIGDRLDVIASGPTAPDESTFADASLVVEKYGLAGALPARVAAFLKRGEAGQEPETVKSGDPCFGRTRNAIIGGLGQALAAARDKARGLGYEAQILNGELQGDARDAARLIAQAARRAQEGMAHGERLCLLFGGETTVTVRGRGLGGRNQELALAFSLEIDGTAGITLLSAGTDGTDGPTDAAGAVVNGATAAAARGLGIDPVTYLENNDSYTFFNRLDTAAGTRHHIVTGPTGTNVMDIQAVVVDGPLSAA